MKTSLVDGLARMPDDFARAYAESDGPAAVAGYVAAAAPARQREGDVPGLREIVDAHLDPLIRAIEESDPQRELLVRCKDLRALLTAAPARQRAVEGVDLSEACKPWEFHVGEPPDYDSPLSAVFGAGMAYSEKLLAGRLGVEKYEGGDGSEDFDQDATKTLENILTAAKLYDPEDGRWAALSLERADDAAEVKRQLDWANYLALPAMEAAEKLLGTPEIDRTGDPWRFVSWPERADVSPRRGMGERIAHLSNVFERCVSGLVPEEYARGYREALEHVLAAPPPNPAAAPGEALGYAERLAVALWELHWRDESPDWKPLSGDLVGILTQIDNMTAGLRRLAAPPPNPAAAPGEARVTEDPFGFRAVSERVFEPLAVSMLKFAADTADILLIQRDGARAALAVQPAPGTRRPTKDLNEEVEAAFIERERPFVDRVDQIDWAKLPTFRDGYLTAIASAPATLDRATLEAAAIRQIARDVVSSMPALCHPNNASAMRKGDYDSDYAVIAVERAIRALPSASTTAQSGWLPIDTYNPQSDPDLVFVAYENGHVTAAEYVENLTGGPEDDQRWEPWISPKVGDEYKFDWWPTYWMPLPASPEGPRP